MKASKASAWKRAPRGERPVWRSTGPAPGYGRLLATVLVATAVIYALMFLGVRGSADMEFSQTRLWRAVAMGGGVALVMLALMPSLYRRASFNVAIVAGAAVAMLGALWLVRTYRTVDDVAYLKAMIPNHSVAVLASSRARIRDERVRELADEILDRQAREIEEMKALISDLKREPPRTGAPVLAPQTERLSQLEGVSSAR